MCIRPRMDFADARPNTGRRLDLRQLGIDEYARHDACAGQPGDHLPQARFLRHHIEPTLGGNLVTALRYQHYHLRSHDGGDADHFVRCRHFQIEFDLSEFAQACHICVLDVAPVLAQMDGNAVRPAQVSLDRSPCGIRLIGHACLTDGSHVVDIDTQFDHVPAQLYFVESRPGQGWRRHKGNVFPFFYSSG